MPHTSKFRNFVKITAPYWIYSADRANQRQTAPQFVDVNKREVEMIACQSLPALVHVEQVLDLLVLSKRQLNNEQDSTYRC
jgi:hypothetical protein